MSALSQKQVAAIAAKSKHPVERMSWEPSDNGGFVSHTAMKGPARKPGGPYVERPDPDTKTHGNVNDLVAHVKAMASLGQPAAGKAPAGKGAPPSQWSGVANQMLGSGVGPAKGSNGAR
jgi:hypothetical protein